MNETIEKSQRTYKGDSLIESIDNYTIIDIETTGLDPKNDKIIELAAIKVKNNEVIDTYSALINPEIEIDNFITELTGITNDMLIKVPTIDKKIKEYIDFIGEDIIVGHNVNFDINFIYDNYLRIYNLPFSNDYIDTLRISKNYIRDIANYKLETLSEKFNINYEGAHRALQDCYITNSLYSKLKDILNTGNIERNNFINSINIDNDNPIKRLKILVKGSTKDYSKSELIKICRNNKIKIHSILCSNDYDLVVLSNKKYKNYLDSGGNDYYDLNSKKVISEYDFYDLLGLNYIKGGGKRNRDIRAKDFVAQNNEIDKENPLYEKECVFTGTMDKMSRSEAMQLVVNLGGKNRDTVTKETNYLILGNTNYSYNIKDGKSSKQKKAEKYKLQGQDIEILSENVFYDLIEDYIDD